MAAVETQLKALTVVDFLLNQSQATSYGRDLDWSWKLMDSQLRQAQPFSWGRDVTRAVLAAAQSIPADTVLNYPNLDTSAVWWHFEEPLPFKTVTDQSIDVEALLMGWLRDRFFITCWVNDRGIAGKKFGIQPTQSFTWLSNETLEEMVDRTSALHDQLYGPGGRWHHRPQVGKDMFMAATQGIAAFVLAGFTWMGQRVLIERHGHVERHRRREFNRRTDQSLEGVKIVHLRRADYSGLEPEWDAEIGINDRKREFNCQWVVDGHWRNQPFGPGRAQKRLVYIHPYVKGPKDKPLKVPKLKVFKVER